ncbi:2,3-bisphosphoglycerate-independent phosphoglycerate mutase [Candidatus Parcubacteria bacterium]|nr:2,3-bisphosphoglycerate-independent phosphoglycerate mutase [Candidatus Parcubacteria bacterium]
MYMRPVVLTILDGWGYSKQKLGNAIANAQTPNLNDLAQNYPALLLQASGRAVGMTFGEAGNSEVGHLTLGAGRVIFQYLVRINKAIDNGEFGSNPVIIELAGHVLKSQGTLHIAGLLTSGAVHASFNHFQALIEFAKQQNLAYKLHLFTDGRDSGLKESVSLIQKLLTITSVDTIGTLIGRDFAMDRNNHWDNTKATYDLLFSNQGAVTQNIISQINTYHEQGVTDANLPATVLNPSVIKSGDAIIFINFREDSMRQITRVLVDDEFKEFERVLPQNIFVASMTQYLETPNLHVLFPPPEIKNCLAEVLSNNSKKHFHIAETEKYAHVTYFFNGLHNEPFLGEQDVFIESLESPSEHPEMRAADIAQRVAMELDQGSHDFIVANLANGDMLAHLGGFEATVKGIEAVDMALGFIRDKVLEKGGVMIITADHGNAESLTYSSTGEQETRHDPSPVPFHVIAAEYKKESSPKFNEAAGLLADVAPTILEIMGIEKPVEMTGESLLSLLDLNP